MRRTLFWVRERLSKGTIVGLRISYEATTASCFALVLSETKSRIAEGWRGLLVAKSIFVLGTQ
jgi:hypothetical protein